MSFELAYISKNGTHSYLTTNFGFTHKAKDHRQWANLDQMKQDLIKIKKEHASAFNTRKKNQFYVYDTDTTSLTTVDWSKQPTPEGDEDAQLEKKPYVIAIDTNEGRYYLSTKQGENGKFVAKLDKQIRHWTDLQKARSTVLSLHLNNKFWANYPNWQSQDTFVLDTRTDSPAWVNDALTTTEQLDQSIAPTINGPQLRAQIQRLKRQLTPRFDPNVRHLPSKSMARQKPVPEIDLTKYNAEKVFAAVEYLVEVVSYKKEINRLLNYYDKLVSQDFLHTVEVADLNDFDSQKFVIALHEMRQKRRKIKDLNIMLNALATNWDADSTLRELVNNASLHNQYYYRDGVTATIMDEALKGASKVPPFLFDD